jgi:hypothetical protein
MRDRRSRAGDHALVVHRALDDVDAALPLFEEAAALDRDDTSAFMEAAKMLGAAERFGECEQWFARVLERQPDHEDAQMWQIYAGYAGAAPADEPKYVERMRKFVAAHPDHEQAAGFLEKMTGG